MKSITNWLYNKNWIPHLYIVYKMLSLFLRLFGYCLNFHIILLTFQNFKSEISNNVCNSVRVSIQDGLFTEEFSLPCWICQWTKTCWSPHPRYFTGLTHESLSGHRSPTMGHRFKPIESNYGIPTCLIRLSKLPEWFIIRRCQTIWRSFVVSGECRSPKSSRETQLIFTSVVIKDLAWRTFCSKSEER